MTAGGVSSDLEYRKQLVVETCSACSLGGATKDASYWSEVVQLASRILELVFAMAGLLWTLL